MDLKRECKVCNKNYDIQSWVLDFERVFGLGGGVEVREVVDVGEVGEVFDDGVGDIGIVKSVGVELDVEEIGGVTAELEGEFEE